MNTTKLRWSKWRRSFESVLLIIGVNANLSGLGWVLGGPYLSMLVAICMLLIYWVSPAVTPNLIIRFYRGRRIQWQQAPRVYAIVNELSARAGLKSTPQIYIIPSPVPNAVAVGTDQRSGIALSEGILRRLNMVQLSAVLAHEISHILNNDTRRNALAAISVRLTHHLGIIGQFLLLLNLPLVMIGTWQVSWGLVLSLILSPVIGNALVMALARVHEYQADLQAVELTGDPQSLASALLKLDASGKDFWTHWLRPKVRSLKAWEVFSTHPTTRERINRLEKIWDADANSISISAADVNFSHYQAALNIQNYFELNGNAAECSSHWGSLGERC